LRQRPSRHRHPQWPPDRSHGVVLPVRSGLARGCRRGRRCNRRPGARGLGQLANPRNGAKTVRIIDHFMYAGSNLDALNEAFDSLTGVNPTAGGSHPTLGTRNSLVGTGATTYLELIAPDPSLSTGSELRTALEGMTRNQLHRFIMQCDQRDFPALAQAYGDVGIAAPV